MDFTVVADEVYHLLSFGSPPPIPLGGYCDDGYVLSLGSFSKILAPGLRLGWIQASREMIERLTRCGLLDSSGGLNPFTSALVRVVIEEGWQQQHIDKLRVVYRDRAAAMGRALHRELDGAARFDEPQGGYFYWLRLAEEIDTLALEAAATQHKVGYRAGPRFSSRAGLRNCLRISFAYYEIPELEEGVARLARLLKSNAATA
jgi:DNA-binding transcriptional MocR family regulator